MSGNTPLVQQRQPRSVWNDLVQVLVDDHDSDARLAVEPGDGVEHFFLAQRVELGRRVVEHQQLRPKSQGGGDGLALLLPARESPGRAFGMLSQAHHVECPTGALDDLGRRQAQVLQPELHVFLDGEPDDLRLGALQHDADLAGQVGQVGLARVEAAHLHRAFEHPAERVRHEPVHHVAQRALARAGATGQGQELAALDAQFKWS
jgi:hypothetical protein